MLFKSSKSAYDWMIVGLGNPGIEYEHTRHNAGFMAADELMKSLDGNFSKHKFEAEFGDVSYKGNRLLIVKPQTYMNNSGRAVMAIASFYKIPFDRVVIMFDDISLDVGKIRLRRKGSAGGHNGIKDIIELSGTQDIMRIKIGVGSKPNPEYDLKDWVLGKFPTDQREEFGKAVKLAKDAVLEVITKGIDSAMNKYSK